MDETVASTVIRIIARQAVLEPGDIGMDQTLSELGMDSLGMAEAVFAIEETYDILVPFNLNVRGNDDFAFASVASIIREIEGLVDAKRR